MGTGTGDPNACRQETKDLDIMETGTRDFSTCCQGNRDPDAIRTRTTDPNKCRDLSATGTAHFQCASTGDTSGKAF